jgi:hypothetical protein
VYVCVLQGIERNEIEMTRERERERERNCAKNCAGKKGGDRERERERRRNLVCKCVDLVALLQHEVDSPADDERVHALGAELRYALESLLLVLGAEVLLQDPKHRLLHLWWW